MQSDFTVFREQVAEACHYRKKTPDPLCAAEMQEFFRLKAKEGNSGFAIAYALRWWRAPTANEAALVAG